MTVSEFLTQSAKAISTSLKEGGIKKHKEIPETLAKFCKVLNLENDGKISSYSFYSRSGGSTLSLKLKLDLGKLGKIPVKFEFFIKGQCKVSLYKIGEYHNWIDIYTKICPLFDSRDEYHNLEYRIQGREFVPYAKTSEWRDEEYPQYDDEKPVAEYLQIIKDKALGYIPFIHKIETACFDGEYVNSYNRYNFNKFKVGNMILSEALSFTSCVYASYVTKDRFNIDLSLDDLHALNKYFWNRINDYREYNKNGGDIKPVASYIHDLFWPTPYDETLTKEMLEDIISSAKKECLIDKTKETWDSVYLAANKEYYFARKKLEKEIAEKYKIPVNSVNIYAYHEKSDSCQTPPVPKELTSRFK